MWVKLIFLFLAGTALANPIWKEGSEYQYLVRSRALAGVSKLSPQFSGILLKTLLQIRVVKPDTLVVQFSGAQYARLHTELKHGWDGPIPDQELKYIDFPQGSPYKILLHRGNVQQVFADPKEPVWKVNMVKGVLSHLQFNVDTSLPNQVVPHTEDSDEFQTYTIKEQSVTGHCNTIYDIIPVSHNKHKNINLVPIPQLEGDKLLDVMKIRDYKDCLQLPIYQFAMTKKQEKNLQHTYLTRLTRTNMIVSQNKEYSTIRSSVMTNKIQVRPNLNDMENSDISTMINLTLVNMQPAQRNHQIPSNLVSAGNLTYIYAGDSNTWVEPVLFDLGLDSKSAESTERQELSNESDSEENSSTKRFRRMASSLSIFARLRNNNVSHQRESGYLTRKPTLQRGISPLALGLTEDLLQALDKADLITQANHLTCEIATEIEKPNAITEQNTLEKFTIVTNILRLLDQKEINAVENNLKSLKCLKVFWDVLAQAGTGPAFLNIRESILTGKVKGLEAADLISRLPRAVHEPTAEYIEAFFELITTPEVKNQPFLNTTAPFAFTELVRYVMVWDHQYFYPVRTFGALITDKDKKKLTGTYIPYLANELKKAYDARENNKIVTYTAALGNLAHRQIIPVFEPFLEGKYNLTTFQRTAMVSALKRLTDVKPELVRPIVYKIYQNDLENFEVRIAAVQVLLCSRPPLHMMQRIAEKTNHETDPNVNNAVVTAILSLAELQLKEHREIAQNALLVKPLLNPNVVLNSKYSVNVIQGYMNEQKDLSAWYVLTTLANKNSILPNILKLSMGASVDNLVPPDFYVLYATTDVSLIDQLIKELLLSTSKKNTRNSLVDDIAHKLNILLDKQEAIEGYVVISSQNRVHLFTFDQDTIKNLYNDILDTKHTNDQSMNVSFTTIGNWETTLVYPSEMGLLVSYNLNSPLLTSLNAEALTKSLLNPPSLKLHVEADFVSSKKIMSRLSFTSPFDNQCYITGLDTNWYGRAPGKGDLHVDQKAKTLNIELDATQNESIGGTSGAKFLHFSIVPFTSITEAVSWTSVLAEQRTQLIQWGTPQKTEKRIGPIVFKRESHTSNMSDYRTPPRSNNLFQLLMNYKTSLNSFYEKTELISLFKPGDNTKISLSIDYDYINNVDNIAQNRPKILSKILEDIQWDAKDIEGPVSILESAVNLKVPSQNIRFHCNVAALDTTKLFTSKLLGNCHLHNLKTSSLMKMCGVVDVVKTPSNCPNMQISTTENAYNAKLSYGESCKDGRKINIQVLQQQSEEVKEAIMNSEEFQQCEKAMKEGNKGMKNCRKICKYIDLKDELSLKIETDRAELQSLCYHVLQMFGSNIASGMNLQLRSPQTETNVGQKMSLIDLKLNLPLNSEMMNVTLSTSPLILQTSLDTSKLPLPFQEQLNSTMDIKEKTFCTLGKTNVLTFDGLEYPINVRQCPLVLMISPNHLKQDTNWDIISQLSASQTNVAVLAKILENGRKQLMFVLNGEMNTLEVTQNKQVVLNTKPVEFAGSRALLPEQLSNDLEILELPLNMYKIIVRPAGVHIHFNGKRLQIKADDKYTGLVRGLCGNNDDIKENDLMAPEGCVLQEPQHMVPLYASIDNKCPAAVQQMQKEAQKAECVKEVHQQTNVVSDQEAGRINPYKIFMTHSSKTQCSSLKTDVKRVIMTGGEQICFSVRPLEKCALGCSSDRLMTKTIGYHCQSVNDEALELENRIEKGAHPDLSQRRISLQEEVQTPVDCRRL